MAFVDKTLQCVQCGASFTFSASEPKRCPACREARRSQRQTSGPTGSRRQMFPAVCAQCGVETQVPFEPRQDRPVYCSDCYSKLRLSSRR